MRVFHASVRVADLEVDRVEVSTSELVLIGRKGARIDLDPDELREVPDSVRGCVRRVEVDSEYVSRKHCLLWVEDGRLRVRDLYSAQGTHMSLGGAETVVTSAARVDLSLVPASRAGIAQPDAVDFASACGEPEYVEVLTRHVREWARSTGVELEVRVETREGQLGRTEDTSRLPVGARHALVVSRGMHTARVAFELARDTLARYVVAQNAQFVAVQQGVERAATSHPMVTASKAMQDARWQVARCAAADLRVILLGETGVGKTLMARCYHDASDGGAFITLDCTQHEDVTRLRAELFGAEPGAWPGLTRRYIGAFERARNGTVFIDEVGDLGAENQGQLLTFLDRGHFTRMMGNEELVSNARILCGTRQDLRRAVAEGRFREDLWYRLAGMVITLPPLRERPDDIRALLDEHVVDVNGEERSATRALTPEALRFLLRYPWPGNARELEMFCRRLPIFLDGRELADELLCEKALRAGDPGVKPSTRPSTPAAPFVAQREGDAWQPPVEFDDGRPARLRAVSWSGVIEAALSDYAHTRGVAVTDDQALRALFALDGEPLGSAFRDFVEKHLKPRFVARATGVDGRRTLPAGFVAEHWKLALGFADGTSVRQLLRASFVLDRRQRLRAELERQGRKVSAVDLLRLGAERSTDVLDAWIARAERGEDPFSDPTAR